MNVDAHKRGIAESTEAIRECVRKGVEKWQRTVGFHCSAAAVDIFEVWLHQQRIIDPGMNVKHEWFSSLDKVRKRFPMTFPRKEKVLQLMVELEKKRNLLCYGKQQPRETVESYIESFNAIRDVLRELGVEYE